MTLFRLRALWAFCVLTLAFALASCGNGKFQSYHGPEVTRIIVLKSQRKMYLMHGRKALKSYDVELGWAPDGHKEFEGDGRTPEGSYFIKFHNPQSQFHLSLGISYPNAADVARARAMGKRPGGDIMIHGGRRPTDPARKDWTWGCISVSNKEIETIYAMVRDNTQIDIYP